MAGMEPCMAAVRYQRVDSTKFCSTPSPRSYIRARLNWAGSEPPSASLRSRSAATASWPASCAAWERCSVGARLRPNSFDTRNVEALKTWPPVIFPYLANQVTTIAQESCECGMCGNMLETKRVTLQWYIISCYTRYKCQANIRSSVKSSV